MTLVYDDGTKDVPIEGEVSFWVVPWGLIFMAIAALAVPVIIDRLFIRLRRKRRQAKSTRVKKASDE